MLVTVMCLWKNGTFKIRRKALAEFDCIDAVLLKLRSSRLRLCFVEPDDIRSLVAIGIRRRISVCSEEPGCEVWLNSCLIIVNVHSLHSILAL